MKAVGGIGWLAVLCLVGVGCSGASQESAGGGDASGGDGALATLDVFESEVAVRADMAAPLEPVVDERTLTQGDHVVTNSTGFGEIVFFDGSWQRVEAETTVALTELVDIENGQMVRTSLDRGRAWNRVETLTDEDDAYQVDTPVAVASVRGTAFAVECGGAPVACTFSVVEGVVELAVSNGTTVDLVAGDRLRVQPDQPIGMPDNVGLAVLEAEPWIAKNLELDRVAPPEPPAGGEPGDRSVTSVEGVFVADAGEICRIAGEKNAALVTTVGDDRTRQEIAILAIALGQLEELQPPTDTADTYRQMLADYRRRNDLAEQALSADVARRTTLVTQLVEATADGASKARALGLDRCALHTN